MAWPAPPHAGCHPVPRERPRDRTERRSLHAAHRWEKHPQAGVGQEGTNDERPMACTWGGNRSSARRPPLGDERLWWWPRHAGVGQEGKGDARHATHACGGNSSPARMGWISCPTDRHKSRSLRAAYTRLTLSQSVAAGDEAGNAGHAPRAWGENPHPAGTGEDWEVIGRRTSPREAAGALGSAPLGRAPVPAPSPSRPTARSAARMRHAPPLVGSPDASTPV